MEFVTPREFVDIYLAWVEEKIVQNKVPSLFIDTFESLEQFPQSSVSH
jgi:hypothetical protein